MREGIEQVGVRELRQNLSVYLRRIKEGTTLEVTEHGHPVAHLVPVPPPTLGVIGRLIAEGRATLPRADLLDWLERTPPLARGRGPSLADQLVADRDEDDR